MATILELPTAKEDLARAIDALVGPAITYRNIHLVNWYIGRFFLRGIRQFWVSDWERGTVDIAYEDENGDMNMRWDEPVTQLGTEVGRLMRLDISPVVQKQGHALASMRDASMAKIILDAAMPDLTGVAKAQFINMVCMDGMCGIAAWEDNTIDNPLAHSLEFIPAWELLGIPHGTLSPTDVRAEVRVRLFPWLQLQKLDGVSVRGIKEEEFEIIELPHGSDTSLGMNDAFSGSGSRMGGGGFHQFIDTTQPDRQPSKRRGKDKPLMDTEKFVRLVEMHILGPQNSLVRYIAKAGRVILKDSGNLDSRKRVPYPIGRAIYDDIGTFYGRSFMSKIIPFAMALEDLLQSVMQGAADTDRFGLTLVPLDWNLDFEAFNNVDGNPTICAYSSDETNKDGLHQIHPASSTDVPARVTALAMGAIDRITGHGPTLSGQAPGRADSGEAFRELNESASTGLLPKAAFLEAAYVTVFRRVLYNARARVLKAPDDFQKGLPLTKIDNSIAGIIIDPETGLVQINQNRMPDPYGVKLSIGSKDPDSKERQRSEAISAYNSGLISQDELVIMNYKEDWGLPLGKIHIWENYLRAVLINLAMFGDGETPGVLPGADPKSDNRGSFFDSDFDLAHIHMIAIEDFTTGHEFHLASDDVVNAFRQRKRALKPFVTGGEFPAGLETAEQAAAQAAPAEGQNAEGSLQIAQ